MIYFIDEDEIQMRPLRVELALRSIPTSQILNADDALRSALVFSSEDYFFVDVMLAVESEDKSQFTRTETDDYKLTGLSLVPRLCSANSAIKPDHIILMSQATSRVMTERITSYSKKFGYRFLPKNYDKPKAFGDQVVAILGKETPP